MKLSTSEEYGLRCLIAVARRAPDPDSEPVSIRDIADAEGLSADYTAKLLAALRKGGFLTSSRGAQGGYRLARTPGAITAGEVMRHLDSPLYGGDFCSAHRGRQTCCVHKEVDCTLTHLWSAVSTAIDAVIDRITLADLLTPPSAKAALGAHHG